MVYPITLLHCRYINSYNYIAFPSKLHLQKLLTKNINLKIVLKIKSPLPPKSEEIVVSALSLTISEIRTFCQKLCKQIGLKNLSFYQKFELLTLCDLIYLPFD